MTHTFYLCKKSRPFTWSETFAAPIHTNLYTCNLQVESSHLEVHSPHKLHGDRDYKGYRLGQFQIATTESATLERSRSRSGTIGLQGLGCPEERMPL